MDGLPHALAAVLAEWTSVRDYRSRVANLRGNGSGPRLNGTVLLKAACPDATVFDDGDQDTLTGSAGRDWFFANRDCGVRDTLTDDHGNELVDNVD